MNLTKSLKLPISARCHIARLLSSSTQCRIDHSLVEIGQNSTAEANTSRQKKPTLNNFSLRTHNCGELGLEHVGEQVELYGWLASKRMQSRFMVLRDAYGKVQVRVPEERLASLQNLLNGTNCESSLCIKGRVMDRGESYRNKKMPTGDIEVELDELEVLGQAPPEMPMQVEPRKILTSELTRLTHRHLDLRTERMQKNLRLRSNLLQKMRHFLHEKCGFVEVETPTLSQSTPGGAAEFIVPAPRFLLGHFYSLPQSPQIYKQLLMCGGIDRYFQIARCYRDEGTRPDRQPEFTQVDMELSYTTQPMVISLIEQLIIDSWPEELASDRPSAPFPQMSYADAMRLYGSDKPDLRYEAGADGRDVDGVDEDHENEGGQKKKRGNARKKRMAKGAKSFEFLWVTNFPLFLRDAESGRLESAHHPFTAPMEEDRLAMMRMGTSVDSATPSLPDVEQLRAQHYDLVLNGVELGGGSIRIHRVDEQRHVLEKILECPTKTLEPFLAALGHGAPPHGGFALGLDRYVALLANKGERTEPNTVRDVMAFPKTRNGSCKIMGAPAGEIDPLVLRRYAITLDQSAIEEWNRKHKDDDETKKDQIVGKEEKNIEKKLS